MTKVFATEHETVVNVGRWLGETEPGSLLTDRARQRIAGRIVSSRAWLTTIFDEITPDAHRKRLQSQQTNRYEDADHILERLHELEAEKGLLYGYLRAMGSPYAAEYDPDVVAQDREDTRAREDRQDEAARTEAPKVAS